MHDHIDILLNDIRPDRCLAEGLDCRNCTHTAAGHVATLCPTVDAGSLMGVFREIFVHPSCGVVYQSFEHAYFDALERISEPVLAATAA